MKFSRNPRDIQHEQEFARRWEKRFPKQKMSKLTDHQRLDFLVMNQQTNTGWAFCEYKFRNIPYERFDSVYLNLNKWLAFSQIASETKLPVLFACTFGEAADADYLYHYQPEDKFAIGYADQSMEAVVLIPREKFRALKFS